MQSLRNSEISLPSSEVDYKLHNSELNVLYCAQKCLKRDYTRSKEKLINLCKCKLRAGHVSLSLLVTKHTEKAFSKQDERRVRFSSVSNLAGLALK